MKIVVTVIVYNRYSNLERWLRCWKDCDHYGSELIVIHTGEEVEKFKTLCEENKVRYVHRKNIGFDIGAYQDVCRERLNGFPNDWEYLLWITDDTIPMSKDFIKPFIEKLTPGVGITAMQISASVSPHVRTTGFCLKKETAKRLTFPADPITTRQQCYFFEHRGGQKTLTNQVRAMGLSCIQVAPNNVSPLWDTGYWRRLDRQAEHEKIFPSGKIEGDKVTVIATIYDSFPQIISSLLLQTHKNWQLKLIHDGPASDSIKSLIDTQDERVEFIETAERKQNYGHHLRKMALEEIELNDYVLITNSDNYYVPVFLEYMLKGFKKSHTTVATYCSDTVHSYKAWNILPAKLERGFIDCGAVLIKSQIAKEVGWSNITDHSADWIFFSEIAAKYSWKNFEKVKGALFVHN